MPTFDDVARIALELPGTEEVLSRGLRQWKVRGKHFVWERPLGKSDLAALGDVAPAGDILAASVEHEVAKQALLADPSGVYFTTPHFDGYACVLAQLGRIGLDDLRELIVEAYLVRSSRGASRRSKP